MIIINNGDFEEVERYCGSCGDRFDEDRMIEITVKGVNVMLCLDEDNKVIQVIAADGEVVDNSNRETIEDCMEEVIEASKDTIYTTKEERYWNLYIEDIRTETKCPEATDNMLLFKFVA